MLVLIYSTVELINSRPPTVTLNSENNANITLPRVLHLLIKPSQPSYFSAQLCYAQHLSFHSYHIFILCFYWTNSFYIQITFILQHKKITFIIKSSKFWLFDKMKLRLSLPIYNVCLRWFSISKFVFSKNIFHKNLDARDNM